VRMTEATQAPAAGPGPGVDVPTTLLHIPLGQLVPSPTNPRRSTDNGQALEELAESIRAKGVLQPVLVRPKPDRAEAWELVCGHRRVAAAKLAGLEAVPAQVRELSDTEALEAQIVENCQREDVHPLEEADSYQTLHTKHGHAIDDLAAKVGKSRAYVYARLKLCALAPAPRKAFLAGDLNPSTALMVARIPSPKLQAEASKAIVSREMSVRDAASFVQRSYMLQLSSATFDTADPELLAAATACRDCPKRTGAQRELFSDVKSADVCTDPPCFKAKTAAAFKARAADVEAVGGKVLTAKETDKVVGWGGVHPNSGYVDLDARCEGDPKRRTWRRLLGGAAPPTVLTQPDRDGKPHELIAASEATRALKAKHPTLTAKRPPSAEEARYRADQKRSRNKARLEADVREATLRAIRDKHAARLKGPGNLSRADLELLATGIWRELWHEHHVSLFKLWGWEHPAKDQYGHQPLGVAFRKLLPKLPLSSLVLLLVDFALVRELHGGLDPSGRNVLNAEAKRARVNPEKIRREVTAAAKAKAKPKRAPRAGAKAPASRTATKAAKPKGKASARGGK